MRIILTVFLLCCGVASRAQQEMFTEAFEDFLTSRFWEYEPITVNWTMEGVIQAELNEGINNLLEEKTELAVFNFSEVLEKDSSLWQAYYYRAACRKKMNKLRAAQNDLQKALKLRPDFYEGRVELAKVYHIRWMLIESEHELKRALQIDNTRPIAHYLKGDINLQQNQLRNAIHKYNDCLQADSLFHDARIKLALINFIAKKNEKEALQHLNQVLEYDSLQKSALLFRSLFIYAQDKQQSVRDLTNLLLVSPNNLMALYFRGTVSTELENYNRAFVDFQKIINATSASDNEFVGQQTWIDKKIDLQNVGAYTLTRIYGLSEDDAANLKKAYCLILTNQFDKSITAINQTSNPNEEPLSVYLKAVAYEHQGNHNNAYQFYDLALSLDNEIADAHKKRAIYEQELKEWDKSVKDLNEVLRINPDAFITYKIRGTSYFYLNRFPEALKDFNAYLERDSTNKDVISYRGMTYLKMQQRLKAYIDFANSGTTQMFNFYDMTHLIDSVLSKGDTTQALFALTELTKGQPYFTEGFARKFRIHYQQDDWKSIDQDILRALRGSRVDAPKADHAYLLTLQAMNYAKNRHEEDAIKAFGEAIKFDKNNSLAYLERAKLWIAQGKSSKAESDLKQAVAMGNKQAEQLLAERMKDNH